MRRRTVLDTGDGRNPFADEVEIIWTVPVATLPRYVRQIHLSCLPRRRGPVRYNGLDVVGWANLAAMAPSDHGSFRRRIFLLKSYDPYQPSGAPSEAIDPRTVRPRVAGRMTQRAWGRVVRRVKKDPSLPPAASPTTSDPEVPQNG